MNPSLEARDLSRNFGTFTALSHLNLKVEGTKCVGFLGPNGAGKTTTLKMFTDLIFPSAGEAFINGISVQKDRKSALSSCGALIETPEIYGSLTPREALELIGSLRGMERADVRSRTDEVLNEVKMTEWADKKVGKFSKGMKQRINIASTLLSDPDVVMLDEPSTGLDPRGMAEVRGIIRGLKGEGRLVFFSSHILSEVVDVCDEVVLIDKGKLLFYDTLDHVNARLTAGGTSVDVEFVRPVSDDDVKGRLASLPGVSGWSRLDGRRLSLVVQGGPDVRSHVLESVAALRLGLVGFHESRSALEDVYLREITSGDS
ncbi:MAG TPA: ABC transporter ATP-binding protein [Thermoplasmata archaeon]|nr:ABC transporter ATP-binding protein [Thermoplasmata archaeon]